MDHNNEDSITKLINQLKKEYNLIRKIIIEDRNLVIYADDNTLWKIFEDFRDQYNIDFEAGTQEEHFIRIINLD
jgi:hypothetical protein